jgi:small multidrug resistance pump
MPVGIVYAVWSGSGIVLIAAIAWLYYRQTIDLPGIVGIALIIAGVIVVNLFSKSVGH